MDYILKTVRNLDQNVTISVSQPADINDVSIKSWDVFISHATEDKEAVAEPLSRALMKAGVSVWYGAFMLKVGDSLMFPSITVCESRSLE
jgi:TIR domain